MGFLWNPFKDEAYVCKRMLPKMIVFMCLVLPTVSAEIYQIPEDSCPPVPGQLHRSRIVGGTNAEPHEFPYMVTLSKGLKYFNHVCGGAILNESWILTAGHCLSPIKDSNESYVKAGKHSLYCPEENEQDAIISKIFVHENYTSGPAPNDIALLLLEKPLVFNKYVQPIALPKNLGDVTGNVTLSGWGKFYYGAQPDILQKIDLPIIDTDTCKKAELMLMPNFPSKLVDTMICTGPLIQEISGCKGDSGSPLVKRENNTVYLVGIFSWFFQPCGTEGAPSVYTNVSHYINWIEETMNS